jgi:hypothetical protein
VAPCSLSGLVGLLVGDTVELRGYPKARVGGRATDHGVMLWSTSLNLGVPPMGSNPLLAPGNTGYGYNPPGCGTTMLRNAAEA